MQTCTNQLNSQLSVYYQTFTNQLNSQLSVYYQTCTNQLNSHLSVYYQTARINSTAICQYITKRARMKSTAICQYNTKLHEWTQQPSVSILPNCTNELNSHLSVYYQSARMNSTAICQYITKLLNLRFLEGNRYSTVGLLTRLWDGRYQVSNSSKGECFLCPPKLPGWLWGTPLPG